MRKGWFIEICLYIAITSQISSAVRWKCEVGSRTCVKTRDAGVAGKPSFGLEACKMFCNDYGLLWPRPTGKVDLGGFLSKINLENISLQIAYPGKSDDLVQAAFERFIRMASLAVPKDAKPKSNGKAITVIIVNQNPDLREFSLAMDESYKLSIHVASKHSIITTITGKSFFGVRHGLETLAQLFVYDDHTKQVLLVRDAKIEDKPVYPYRGLLVDTSRNYYSVDSIKATIDAMAAVKLNSFHWHITDMQSFPFVSERRPELSNIGAYSPSQVYTKQAIRDIVQYALERGVRVIPEFDGPAHVGEGWQDSNLTVCFGAQPWRKYCASPPCGQLNPIRRQLYDYLEDIYTDMAEAFKPDIFHMGGDEVSEICWSSSAEIRNFMIQNRWGLNKSGFLKLWNYFQSKAQHTAYKAFKPDIFHMGGDEVSEICWSSSAEIRNFMIQNRWGLNKSGFLKLWNYFQSKAQHTAYKAFGKKLPLVLWTSTLTDYANVEKYLDNKDYIIQVWTTGVDPQIQGLLKRGYRLIMSNYDALYLDCGFGSWVGAAGNNWCSPYIGWQKVYDNSPLQMATDKYSAQVIGGEAALWSEQADSAALDGRVWPRTAALAERLWAEPKDGWKSAERRMLHMRERFVRMGVQADTLQPLWCYQNEGMCDNKL